MPIEKCRESEMFNIFYLIEWNRFEMALRTNICWRNSNPHGYIVSPVKSLWISAIECAWSSCLVSSIRRHWGGRFHEKIILVSGWQSWRLMFENKIYVVDYEFIFCVTHFLIYQLASLPAACHYALGYRYYEFTAHHDDKFRRSDDESSRNTFSRFTDNDAGGWGYSSCTKVDLKWTLRSPVHNQESSTAAH